MTVQVLDDFAAGGLVSAPQGAATAPAHWSSNSASSRRASTQPISGLSGGNQQKAVLARSFLYGAEAILIDEPTQGVDANARFDIYRAIRAKADEGGACIVNSSDALELPGICDRVLVFSRGRVVRELRGAEVTEESIVSSFLTSRGGAPRTAHASRRAAALASRRDPSADRCPAAAASWWVPLAFLVVLTLLVGAYAAIAVDVFLTRAQHPPHPAGHRARWRW